MQASTSSSPVWRWTILMGIALAGLAVVALLATVPSEAGEKSISYNHQTKLTAGSMGSGEPHMGKALLMAQQTTEEPKKEEKPPPAAEEPKKEEKPKQDVQEPKKEEKPKEADKPKPADKDKKELDNQSCMDCHGPDILKMSPEELQENVEIEGKPAPPKTKPKYVFGELNLAIDEKKFGDGVHGSTTCVECHADIKDAPHKQRLKAVDCAACHEEPVEQVSGSAHGKKAAQKGLTCIGCHDVHYGKGKDAYEKDFQGKICLDCHNAYGLDTIKAHAKLYEYQLHAKMGCLICHAADKPLVHTVPPVKTRVAKCESCHKLDTALSKAKPKPVGFSAYITQSDFTNAGVLKKYGYVIGAHRIPLLDTIIILAVLGPLGLPLFHGGLRILTRRKGPIELPEEKILLHPLPERLWHWFQALCIVILIITGIMLHWPELCPGWFDWSVTVHNWAGWGAVIGFVFWLFYNLGTGRIRHYFPKKGDIPVGVMRQAKFYGYGIFKHDPHPYAPSEDNKFNPLQKIAYLQFQLLLLPILLISGLLYMYPTTFAGIISALGGMTVLATIHYILGGLFAAFLVAHLYLATTGETVGENFKAIVTGYGIKGHDDTHHA